MKILLFLPNYIGDVLMTTPAIRVLKKCLPEAKVYVTIKDYVKEVINDNPNVDEIIFKFPKLTFLKRIKNERFNYALLFRTTFFNSLSTFISRASFSVGFDEEFSKIFLSKVIKKDNIRSYRYECILLVQELLSYLGINFKSDIEEVKKIDYYGFETDIIKNLLKEKLSKNKIELDKPVVILSPFASRQTKMLTVNQCIDIVNKLYEINRNMEIIIVGQLNNKQMSFLHTILQNTTKKIKSLCNQLSLKELGLLCSISKLVISVDTGIAYIAESVGIPTIIIFTSTLPEKYGPFSQNVRYIYSPTICSPCYKNECPNKTYKCVEQVNIKEVVNIAKNILS